MNPDDGGWTLVMRFIQASDELRYEAVYWDTEALLNEMDLVRNGEGNSGESKYRSYNEVVAQRLRLKFIDPVHGIHFDDLAGGTALASSAALKSWLPVTRFHGAMEHC